MTANSLAPIPPDRVLDLLSGGTEEQWDLRLVEGTRWLDGPPKVVRLKDLEAADEATVGTVVKLCLDLFVGAWDKVAFGPAASDPADHAPASAA